MAVKNAQEPIDEVVELADSRMYEDKKQTKEEGDHPARAKSHKALV